VASSCICESLCCFYIRALSDSGRCDLDFHYPVAVRAAFFSPALLRAGEQARAETARHWRVNGDSERTGNAP